MTRPLAPAAAPKIATRASVATRTKVATPERIIDAATGMFWRSGYHAVSMDDICAAADVRKGSLYNAFASKADLVGVILDRVWQSNHAEFRAIYAANAPIRAQIQAHFEWFGSSQALLKTRFGFVPGTFNMALGLEVPASIVARMDAHRGEHQALLQTGLVALIEDERRSPAYAAWMAKMVVSAINGVVINARLTNSLDGFTDLPQSLFALMGLSPPPLAAAQGLPQP